MMKKILCSTLMLCGLMTVSNLFAQSESYQTPPASIKQILDSQPAPTVVLGSGSNQNFMAILQQDNLFLDIEDIALNEYRIGGIRANVNNFSVTRVNHPNNIWLKLSGEEKSISGLPEELNIVNLKWSPSNKYVVFANVTPDEIELWRVDAQSLEATKINEYPLNFTTLRDGYFFLDDETILYPATIVGTQAPDMNKLATGPAVQEVYGKKFGGRTIADVISNPAEEDMFEYLATSQLVIFSEGKTTKVGEPAIISSINLSPDKQYMMLRTSHKPYSYITAFSSFPHKLELVEVATGKVIKTLEDKTVEEEEDDDKKDKTPKPSSYDWRSDMPATLYWTEKVVDEEEEKGKGDAPAHAPKGDAPAPKGDDAKKEKPEEKPEKTFQTMVYQQAAPFTAEKELILTSEYTFSGITWGNETFAIYNDSSRKQKVRRTLSFNPADTSVSQELLFAKSTLPDTVKNYTVTGRPYTVENQYGAEVLYLDKKPTTLYFTGSDRPDAEGVVMSYVDAFDLKKKEFKELWISEAPYKSSIIKIENPKNLEVLVSRESPTTPTNYALINAKKGTATELTSFADPVPAIRELGREYVSYMRKDSVEQRALLITPKGYNKETDGTLPVFMWAYPREYKSAVEAEKKQVHKYAFVATTSAALVALEGYAVMLDMSMFIISENTESEPNDVFIPQLVSNAEAAVDFVVDYGVGDRHRIGVGGHSYGAFMTAHLLSHSDLFAAGVARSGAYNRSLTPFGFQTERRTYWKASDLYFEMSPFSHVDKLTDPILLIHGGLDENTGTFPIQSQRLYQAISYLGNTSRYVVLPYESHGYRAIQSNYQLWWETMSWLDKYVKDAKPKEKKKAPKEDDEEEDDMPPRGGRR
ncbi:MAG: prolyl oligopeptidase family serine peptidase [Rikenellaceae bacterium]